MLKDFIAPKNNTYILNLSSMFSLMSHCVSINMSPSAHSASSPLANAQCLKTMLSAQEVLSEGIERTGLKPLQ